MRPHSVVVADPLPEERLSAALELSFVAPLFVFPLGVPLGWWSSGFLTLSGLKVLILPSMTLRLFQMTLIQRLVCSKMLEVLRTDYIKFARAC